MYVCQPVVWFCLRLSASPAFMSVSIVRSVGARAPVSFDLSMRFQSISAGLSVSVSACLGLNMLSCVRLCLCVSLHLLLPLLLFLLGYLNLLLPLFLHFFALLRLRLYLSTSLCLCVSQ